MPKSCIFCGFDPANTGSFHRFPTDPHMRSKWQEICQLPSTSASYLCSKHFIEQDFSPVGIKRKLKPSAVPSIHLTRKPRRTCYICGSTAEELSYYPFPKNEIECLLWKQTFNIPDATDVSRQYLCSKHLLIKHGRRKCLKPLLSDDQLESETTTKSHSSCILCRTNDARYSYHRFPKISDGGHSWLTACQLPTELGSTNSSLNKIRLCSKHFRDEDYVNLAKNKKGHLKRGVLPTVFDETELSTVEKAASNDKKLNEAGTVSAQETVREYKNSNSLAQLVNNTINTNATDEERKCNISMPELSRSDASTSFVCTAEDLSFSTVTSTPSTSMDHSNRQTKNRIRYPGDIRTPQINSPISARKGVPFLRTELAKYKKQNILLRRKLERKIKKLTNMDQIIEHLKSANNFSEETKQHLLVAYIA